MSIKGIHKDGIFTDLYINGTRVLDENRSLRVTNAKVRDDMNVLGNLSVNNIISPSIDYLQEQLDVFNPKNLPTTGALQFELVNDTSPLNYSSSRAISVIQQRDTLPGGSNELIPGTVEQFTNTGNGVVNSGIEYSSTIWMSKFVEQTKTGDGSGHCFTGIGQLGPYGPGGYNELGGFQGTFTNIGSHKGTISGVEVGVVDSPDGGVTSYDTKMEAVVGRVAKFNPSSRLSTAFYASSEGSQPPNGVLMVNPQGANFIRGIDLKDGNFTSGQAVLLPNNTNLGWMLNSATPAPIMFVDSTNAIYIQMPTSSTPVNIATNTSAVRLSVDNDPSNAVAMWLGGSLQRVTLGAPNSGGSGFRALIVPN